MKKLLFSLISVGAFAGNMQGVVFHEWEESLGGNGHLYTVVGETPEEVMNWPDAQLEAQSIGGYLVTIESAAELNFVRNAFGRTELFWTGLNTGDGSGSFQWANGESVVYSYFGGQAVDPNVTSAVVINQLNSRGFTRGEFGVADPTTSQYRAIVEFDAANPPTEPIEGVPDTGNPLLLVLISLGAGVVCRFLKR